MPQTTRLGIPYPADGQSPWYASFKAFIDGVDAYLFSATEDRNLLVIGGGTLSWSDGAFSWSDPIVFVTPSTGKLQTLEAGSISLIDGQMMLVSLTRGATVSVALTSSIATYATAGASILVFAFCLDGVLHLRTGQSATDGDSFTLSSGVSSVDVDDDFTLDGNTWTFTLTSTPSDGSIPQVFIGDVLMTSGYEIVDDQLTLEEFETYIDVSGWKIRVHYRARP